MKAKHTQGRWYLQEYTDKYTNIIRCDAGKGYETLFIGYTPQDPNPEFRHNAQLMATAPDLLAALKEIAEAKGAYSPDRLEHASNTIRDMVAIAEAAIKKAAE